MRILNIVETAKQSGQFATLLTAAEAAGLVELLSNEGPITIFAPTDAAFAALPKGTVPALLKDKDKLANILKYHVISGDLALAINQLKLAQAVPGINAVQRERFDARIRELQEYLPKGRRAREVAEPQSPDPEGEGRS